MQVWMNAADSPAVTEFLAVRNGQIPYLMRLSVNGRDMVMKRWVHTVLKVVVMAVTMCSGIRVPNGDGPAGDQGHEGGRAIRHTQRDIDRAA